MALEFLVELEIRLPSGLSEQERADLLRRETAYGRTLVAAGTIQRIWRITGRLANVGVWTAVDATSLHDAIPGLSMYPWATVTVRALATHPLEVS